MCQLVNDCRAVLKKECFSSISKWSFTEWHDYFCDILAIFSESYDKFHAVRKDNTRLSRKIYWAYIPLYWRFPEIDISSYVTRNHNL